jgi:hypothetical protein
MEDRVYDLDCLDGHQFEAAIVELFRRLGYSTERGKLTNDEGRDIVARKDGATIVVECKHQKANVGRPVVQKLHSAADTFGRQQATIATGIIVTTGGFSPEAVQYIHQNALRIELWDYAKLVERGREARVFFAAQRHGTRFYFQIAGRTDEELRSQFWARHLSGLKSNPRPVPGCVQIESTLQEIVPATIVDYRVDKPFTTQAGTVYWAREAWRRFFPIAGRSIGSVEEEYWRASQITVLDSQTVGGRPLASYFGTSPNSFGSALAGEVAQRLSRVVRYAGRNHQSYTKYCEVSAADVEVTARQVLLLRHAVGIRTGPQRYSIGIADDRTRPWAVSTAQGFADGAEGLVYGDGIICNDCGLIAPARGTLSGSWCDGCQRTLCRRHNWLWPGKGLGWIPLINCIGKGRRLCSDCYKRTDPATDLLDDSRPFLRNLLLMALLGLIPGLSFMIGKRPILGAAFFAITSLVLVLSIVVLDDPGASAGIPLAGVLTCCLASIFSSLNWAARLRLHGKNTDQLSDYRAIWE